jgi:hypothetical protein
MVTGFVFFFQSSFSLCRVLSDVRFQSELCKKKRKTLQGELSSFPNRSWVKDSQPRPAQFRKVFPPPGFVKAQLVCLQLAPRVLLQERKTGLSLALMLASEHQGWQAPAVALKFDCLQ